MNSFSSNWNENTQIEEKEIKEDKIEEIPTESKEEKSSIWEIPDWLMWNKSDSYVPPKIDIPEEKEKCRWNFWR